MGPWFFSKKNEDSDNEQVNDNTRPVSRPRGMPQNVRGEHRRPPGQRRSQVATDVEAPGTHRRAPPPGQSHSQHADAAPGARTGSRSYGQSLITRPAQPSVKSAPNNNHTRENEPVSSRSEPPNNRTNKESTFSNNTNSKSRRDLPLNAATVKVLQRQQQPRTHRPTPQSAISNRSAPPPANRSVPPATNRSAPQPPATNRSAPQPPATNRSAPPPATARGGIPKMPNRPSTGQGPTGPKRQSNDRPNRSETNPISPPSRTPYVRNPAHGSSSSSHPRDARSTERALDQPHSQGHHQQQHRTLSSSSPGGNNNQPRGSNPNKSDTRTVVQNNSNTNQATPVINNSSSRSDSVTQGRTNNTDTSNNTNDRLTNITASQNSGQNTTSGLRSAPVRPKARTRNIENNNSDTAQHVHDDRVPVLHQSGSQPVNQRQNNATVSSSSSSGGTRHPSSRGDRPQATRPEPALSERGSKIQAIAVDTCLQSPSQNVERNLTRQTVNGSEVANASRNMPNMRTYSVTAQASRGSSSHRVSEQSPIESNATDPSSGTTNNNAADRSRPTNNGTAATHSTNNTPVRGPASSERIRSGNTENDSERIRNNSTGNSRSAQESNSVGGTSVVNNSVHLNQVNVDIEGVNTGSMNNANTTNNIATSTQPSNTTNNIGASTQPSTTYHTTSVNTMNTINNQHSANRNNDSSRGNLTSTLPDILNSHALPPYAPRPQNQSRSSRNRTVASERGRTQMNRRPALNTQLSAGAGFGKCFSRLCCLKCLTVMTTFRWVLISLALLGVCCVIAGIILGAVHMTVTSSFLTLSLMFIGLGIILVIVVGIGWRCTPQGHEPCHLLFNLGQHAAFWDEVTGATRPRTTTARNQWTGGAIYTEFQYRRPPPTYNASMQEYQQRVILAQIQNQTLHAAAVRNGTGNAPNSPPPTYKSHVSTTRPALHITFPIPQGDDYPSSRPPTYRSSVGSMARPRINTDQDTNNQQLPSSNTGANQRDNHANSSAVNQSDNLSNSPAGSDTLQRVNQVVNYLDSVLDNSVNNTETNNATLNEFGRDTSEHNPSSAGSASNRAVGSESASSSTIRDVGPDTRNSASSSTNTPSNVTDTHL